jgi:hypothetical protein
MGDSRRLLSGRAPLDVREPFLSDFSTLSMQLSACRRFAAVTERRHEALSGEHPLENRVDCIWVIVEQRLKLASASDCAGNLTAPVRCEHLVATQPRRRSRGRAPWRWRWLQDRAPALASPHRFRWRGRATQWFRRCAIWSAAERSEGSPSRKSSRSISRRSMSTMTNLSGKAS